MPPKVLKSVPNFIQQRQIDIAKLALEEFQSTWDTPYVHKSDSQWLSLLRLDNPKSGCSVKDDDWAKFLKDYIVVRGFDPRKRSLLSDSIAQQCRVDPTDFYALARLWQEEGVTKGLQTSAASKALFFSAPKCECVIFDRLAYLAIKARCVRFKIDSDGLKEYRKTVLSVVKLHEKFWDNVAGKYALSGKVGINFVLRRIADKHLFIEGRLIEAAGFLRDGAGIFLELGFVSEGLGIARETFCG